jgi:peptidase E
MARRLQRQIIAMGGGGFSGIRRHRALEKYLLAQTGMRRPKICFIPTASGDSEAYVKRFYAAYKPLRCSPSHLALFVTTIRDMARHILEQDVIFVGGGNTRNMLALWRLWGIDEAIKKAYQRGTILSGISAGGLAWFQSGLTDSFPRRYAALRCMGLLKGSFCPHFDSEPKRQPIFKRLVRSGELPPGYAADDGVALHFVDEGLEHVVADRPKAIARYFGRPAGPTGVTDLLSERLR